MEGFIGKSLVENKKWIEDVFRDCEDIVKRSYFLDEERIQEIYMVYTDNIVKGSTIEDAIMTNIMNRCTITPSKGENNLKRLMEEVIAVGECKEITKRQGVVDAVLLGDTVLFMEGNATGLQVSTKGFPTRGVSEAKTEVVVQGPKDAFTEVMSTNVVLIRRRIRDPKLKVRRKKIGTRSKTDVAVMYLEDVVSPALVERVMAQLEGISIDGILDSGYIEQFLEKRINSPFPQLQMTERPDKAVSAILEGRVVMVVDNTPFVVMAPTTLNVFFQAAEDYYDRWQIMSFVRALRYVAAFIAMTLPGLYIALTAYHPSMLPTTLALKIAETRQNIPFPVVGEIILMEVAFELLREAGIRLPSPVSSTIGIVGGIIIGQAAVEAGLVSPSVVIVSALTGICSFVIPNISFVSGLRLVKYIIIFLSAVLGLYGFWLGLLLILIHLCSLDSFGIPYLFPFCSGSVNHNHDWEDSIFRFPLQKMKRRPVFARGREKVREEGGENHVFK